jgi:hypothetical protein
MPSFSDRHKYAQTPEISVREELPSKLRRPLVDIAVRRAGSKALRQIIESVLDPYGIDAKPPSQAAVWDSMFGAGDKDLIAARELIPVFCFLASNYSETKHSEQAS